MYCSNCGTELPDDARFCRECGATTQGGGTPPPPGGGKRSDRKLWIAIAAIGVVVVALAIALPLALLGGDGTTTTETISVSSTTGTTATPTTEGTTEATEPPTTETTAEPSTTTTTEKPASGIPGDSAGSWVEANVSGLDQGVNEVALSDDALLFQTSGPAGNQIFAYLFGSGETVQIPTELNAAGLIDIDGSLAVWREANFEGGEALTDSHIYAYRLPDGPKVEVASGAQVDYPQVSEGTITWTEGKPWATQPDEFWDMTIRGAAVDEQGQPTGASTTLVESAIASVVGDSTWTYSLSDGFLAWEQHSSAGAVDAGSYMMDLAEMQPWRIEGEAWRPSLDKNRVVFTRNGIEITSFRAGDAGQIDPSGDFATAAPTYAAYFRPTARGDGTAWAVVARGYNGAYEQALLDDTGTPPWFLRPIAASATRIAFTIDGTLRVFQWQG